jgi:hypothetical protein
MAATPRDLYTLENMTVIMQEYFWQRDINKWHCDGIFWPAHSTYNLLSGCTKALSRKGEYASISASGGW